MENKGYKDLIVWKKAMDLVVSIYELTEKLPRNETYGIISQMQRCAVSIPSNIAEGSKRGTKKDFTHFLIIAFGSGSELETQVGIVKRLSFGKDVNFTKIDLLLDEVMKMLSVFIKKLKTKNYKLMTKNYKVYLGTDHTGFELKEKVKVYLADLGYEVEDRGSFEYVKNDDYPDFAKLVAEEVAGNKESFGIIFGGSGQGEAMCANRTPGVRAAVFYAQKEPITDIDITGAKSTDPFEIVKLVREHNNANILSIATRFVTEDEAKFAIELFLNTKFSGKERHVRRINKLDSSNN